MSFHHLLGEGGSIIYHTAEAVLAHRAGKQPSCFHPIEQECLQLVREGSLTF